MRQQILKYLPIKIAILFSFITVPLIAAIFVNSVVISYLIGAIFFGLLLLVYYIVKGRKSHPELKNKI
jgi:hypothetical protein